MPDQLTAPDPAVRPVAPREDENVLSLHRCKVCGTAWLLWPNVIHGGGWNLLDKYQRPGACCDNAAMGEQIEHLRDIPLAAAPVPCAASPADLEPPLAAIHAAANLAASERNRWERINNRTSEHWESVRIALEGFALAVEVRAPAPTGEGVRDEEEETRIFQDVRPVRLAAAPQDREMPEVQADAPPVTVALDPLRLRDWFNQAHDETVDVFIEIEGMTSPREAAKQAADYMLETLNARLRGEATVRPANAETTTDEDPLTRCADPRNAKWETTRRRLGILLAAIDEAIDRLRAAAPVPCAASPADTEEAALRRMVATVEAEAPTLTGSVTWNALQHILFDWLRLRATGEGARDAMDESRGMRQPDQSVTRRDDRGAGGSGLGSDGRHLDTPAHARTISTQPFDPNNNAVRLDQAGYAPEAETAPLAVSLDPHRLLTVDEFRREVHDKIGVVFNGCNAVLTHREIVRRQCEDFLVEQYARLARLRGEAAVRPERE
jgi:hypothetical protein